jgi:hypothetical protein
MPVSPFGKNSLPFGTGVIVALSFILSANLTLTMSLSSSKVNKEIIVKNTLSPHSLVVNQPAIPVKLTDRLGERLKDVWVFCGLHVVGELTTQRRRETVKMVKNPIAYLRTVFRKLW